MGHIQDRGKSGGRKRWRARVRTPDGRERSRSFDRKADATRWVTEREHAKATGEWVDPSAGRRSLADWAATWLDNRQVAPTTEARERGFMRNHILPWFGNVALADIDQPSVVQWAGDLADDLAPATVRKGHQILGSCLQAAVDAGLIAASPVRNIPLPTVRRTEMRFLTAAEVARLADAIDPRYRAAVLVLAWGGLRISELTALTRGRWDRMNRTVQVAEAVTWVSGEPHRGPPKTEAGHRRVVLPRHVAEAVDSHLAEHTAGELIFTSPEGELLRRNQWRRRQFNPAVEAAGLDPLRIHDLRHTAVSLWIAAGADVKTVTARGGWSSVTTALDRYGHLYPDRDAALADRLEALAADADRAAGQVVDLHERRAEGA